MHTLHRLPALLHVSGDETLTFTFVVINDTAEPITLAFMSALQYDISVASRGGAPPWRWSDDRMFAQAATARELAPGERWVIVERSRVPGTGACTAQASLRCTTHVADATASHDPCKP